MINPRMFDTMSWRMAEVYGACVDKLLINIAKYFPYIKDGREPRGTFDYMVRMLAQMGQVTQESIGIIAQTLGGADATLRSNLLNAIASVIREVDPPLRKAAEAGLLGIGNPPPMMSPSMTQAFQAYYRQSADKLNLVNTVMLESTQQAYTSVVTDVVQRINNAQGALNIATGQVVTGASTWNQAMREAVNTMAQNGLTGFIDHGGHHWSPEAYVAMDIRTTTANAARAAVFEQNEAYGNDLYSVSVHDGARPLCYPWQGKVISRTDSVRDVEDLHGDIIHVIAQSQTSYGQPAGLFGINCGHFPYPFVPGMNVVRGEPQDEEDNARTYEESQQQRKLERDLRAARRDLAIEKARGASPEEIRKCQDKVDRARDKLDAFCDETGRNRRRAREYTPIDAKFPPPDAYDVSDFPTTQRDAMRDYFDNGGVQSGMNPDTVFQPEQQTEPQAVQQTEPAQETAQQGIEAVSNHKELKQYIRDTYGIETTAGVAKLDFGLTKEALTGFESVAKDFPEVGQALQQIRVNAGTRTVMSCDGKKITFSNLHYTEPRVFEETVRRNTESGWWVRNASAGSIGAHETAHQVEEVLIQISGKYPDRRSQVMAWNNCTEARSIVQEACRNVQQIPEHSQKGEATLIQEISRYAYKGGSSETMAEAFADVYANGENASPLSKEIVRVTRQRYLQYKGDGQS